MTTDPDILSHPQGPLRNAREFPEVVNDWKRDTPWYNTNAADSCGDYAIGPSIESYYSRVLPDGRVLAIEQIVFFEVRPDDYFADGGLAPDAEIFSSERSFFVSAASVEAYEDQDFDIEEYVYDDIGIMIRNLVDGEVTAKDVNWLIAEYGDVDDREYIDWNGEPVRV